MSITKEKNRDMENRPKLDRHNNATTEERHGKEPLKMKKESNIHTSKILVDHRHRLSHFSSSAKVLQILSQLNSSKALGTYPR